MMIRKSKPLVDTAIGYNRGGDSAQSSTSLRTGAGSSRRRTPIWAKARLQQTISLGHRIPGLVVALSCSAHLPGDRAGRRLVKRNRAPAPSDARAACGREEEGLEVQMWWRKRSARVQENAINMARGIRRTGPAHSDLDLGEWIGKGKAGSRGRIRGGGGGKKPEA
jgi:hypothetical protein